MVRCGLCVRQVKLTCTSLRAGGVMGTKVKKLPGSMTVAQLKKLCETLFKLKASEQVRQLSLLPSPQISKMKLNAPYCSPSLTPNHSHNAPAHPFPLLSNGFMRTRAGLLTF
jgi:hypothetical protein